MNETIIIQTRVGLNKWYHYRTISDADIREHGLTPAAVINYLKANPPVLGFLFRPLPEYRVLYRLSEIQEVEKFTPTQEKHSQEASHANE